MDSKELWQLSRIVNQVHLSDFSEDDVFILLMLLRRYAKVGGALREFADFLAHREKDRGLIFDYMTEVKNALDRPPPFDGKIEIRPIFTVDDIATEINSILGHEQLVPFSALQMNHLMICIISLLQCTEIWKKDGTSIGQLHVAISSKEIFLIGKIRLVNFGSIYVTFVALTAKNDVLDIVDQDGQAWIQFNGVSWAKTKNNVFAINQYQTTFLG
ncbi:hypothetical protein SAMN05216319_0706 [Duganella sp. CF402]|uniref:hypothetical protein n=1 Tax=unclassified Duganella TaxID=2636909 RepID=UPI0008B0A796|nr:MULTISPECIES: hypothetical protein [unclassified Duganella]RZT10829.1 hypothetical protein EV582_2920 [Duganella sp. BK701]SEK94793.1 hypothetical protein SAMN05216319_0706 [Duganella sp. CF402]